jgi:hypothetical protein
LRTLVSLTYRGVNGRLYVCFWHKADIPIELTHVRFWENNGHRLDARQCLLLTHSGHRRPFQTTRADWYPALS